MEYGGVVLAGAVALVVFLLVPHLAAKRTAVTESREFDRFSPRMRVLRVEGDTDGYPEDCHPDGVRLLAETPRRAELESGVTMRSQTDQRRRVASTAGLSARDTARIREIAALRARRAARLAREQAAGQRRLVASSAAVATIAVIILAATSVVGWAWVVVPVVALAGALGASRWAAIRSEQAGRAETDELHELRRGAPDVPRQMHRVRQERAAGPDVSRTATSGTGAGADRADGRAVTSDDGHAVRADESVKVSSPEGGDIAAEVSVSVEATEGVATAVEVDESGSTGDEAESGAVDSGEVDGPVEAGVVATGTSRTWAATFVPAPTYAARERITGRVVHADTDIRGIPRVAEARVPARPIAEGERPEDARSTEEVVADQPVAFNLDEVLDNRRAL